MEYVKHAKVLNYVCCVSKGRRGGRQRAASDNNQHKINYCRCEGIFHCVSAGEFF